MSQKWREKGNERTNGIDYSSEVEGRDVRIKGEKMHIMTKKKKTEVERKHAFLWEVCSEIRDDRKVDLGIVN